MQPWYECPICKNRYSPEQQRMGLTCNHAGEEWAQINSAEPESRDKATDSDPVSLRAWAQDEQQKRETVEEDRLRERQDNDRLRDALQRSHKELLQYAWYEQGLTGLRERNEAALKLGAP